MTNLDFADIDHPDKVAAFLERCAQDCYQADGDCAAAWQETSAGAPWRACCEQNEIEPHDREVYEHWIVSDWLARRLEEEGEKVDTDFAGLTVWARTCTGQSIALDDVIQRIAVKANSAG
jgi:hypothetical protein